MCDFVGIGKTSNTFQGSADYWMTKLLAIGVKTSHFPCND